MGDENRASYMLHEHTTTEPHFQVNTFNFSESLHPLPVTHKRPVHLQCLQLLSFIINIFMDELTLGNYSYVTWLVTSLPVVKLSLSSLMLPVRSQAFSISHTFFIRLDLGKQTWAHREIDIKLWESSMCFLPCMHSLLRTSTYQCEPWLWSMSLGGVGLYPLSSIVLSGAHL